MTHAPGRLAYYITIACSSTLLFSIQPIITKSILPAFGGSAGVWVTSMLFFQVVLLLGYLYAWCITRTLSPRIQSLLHAAVLVLSLFALPVKPPLVTGAQSPVFSILSVLTVSVGLPYFLLSSTTPLLQAWFAASYTAAFPWRLFALSNAASVIALLAYPVLIEPNSTGSLQLSVWSAAYAALVLSASIAAALHWSAHRVPAPAEPHSRDPETKPLLWIALAACASALWLAVANHLSQEVAPVPFLWVLPLSLYLLSFILCFESDRRWYQPAVFRYLLPTAWLAAGFSLATDHGLIGEISSFSFALFIWCMFCHGELARRKPQHRRDLTFFYLMLALGGALGGLFVALAAPNLFHSYLELPIAIAASFLLGMALAFGVTSKTRLIRLALLAVGAFILATTLRDFTGEVLQVRNFYGASRVASTGSGPQAFRSLYNGRTLHGIEFMASGKLLRPTAYYGPESGAGALLSAPSGPRRVGLVGLGVGTLAAYGRPGDVFRYYEINPQVIAIASNYFSFLGNSPAKIDVIANDGRLALAKEPPASFDVLVLDAFSDDTIPVHLMTKEAFGLYFRLLKPDGSLAIHLTNRYIDLNPVVDAEAAYYHKRAVHIHSQAHPDAHILDADWVILSGPAESPASKTRLWTDDYSNLFQILK